MPITEIYFYAFFQKFRESNVITKLVTKELISRKIISKNIVFPLFTVYCGKTRISLSSLTGKKNFVKSII